MEISSHYYGIYALCLACGIKPRIALKISYASQFVDDAKINTISFIEDYQDELFTPVNGKSKISNIATCHSYFQIKTLNYQAMIFNTSAFHFFPANKGNTFTKKLRCNDNPKVLRELILESINEGSLVPEKLGMLLHIFADTFSHQGFSGLISKENDVQKVNTSQVSRIKLLYDKFVNKFASKVDRIVPAYGHAQVYSCPDIPYGKWSYVYDKSDDFSDVEETSNNDNTVRFGSAFQMIASDFLLKIADKSVYAGKDDVDGKIKAVTDLLVTPMSQKKKIKAWKKLIADLFGEAVATYEETSWVEEAFADFSKKKYKERVVQNAVLKRNYRETSWYAFIKSMKWYKEEFIKRNKQNGLDIPV